MSSHLANAEGFAKALIAITPEGEVNTRLAKLGIPANADALISMTSLVRACGVKSQGEAAVLTVNLTNGAVNATQLTDVLRAAFPGARVGTRHGPHYLSLARTGKLDGVEVARIPHARKAAAAAAPVAAKPVIVAAAAPTEPPVVEVIDRTPVEVPEGETLVRQKKRVLSLPAPVGQAQ